MLKTVFDALDIEQDEGTEPHDDQKLRRLQRVQHLVSDALVELQALEHPDHNAYLQSLMAAEAK
jgi:hypothetical protein